MAITTYDLKSLGDYKYTTYARDGVTNWLAGGANPWPAANTYNMGAYRNKQYANSTTAGVPGTFPSGTISLTAFYGTSYVDEWNCACACDCVCACGGQAGGGGFCFAEGAIVLLEGGQFREITSLKVGDRLWTLQGPQPIMEMKKTILGDRQLFQFADEFMPDLMWTDDHPFLLWTSVLWRARSGEHRNIDFQTRNGHQIRSVRRALEKEAFDLAVFMPIVEIESMLCVNGFLVASHE